MLGLVFAHVFPEARYVLTLLVRRGLILPFFLSILLTLELFKEIMEAQCLIEEGWRQVLEPCGGY